MSEFEDPIDPKALPLRRCSECSGEMHAIEAGSESFGPIARYACASCERQVKIVPMASTGGWIATSLIAWAFLAGLIYLTSKPFDAMSVVWIGLTLTAFLAPFVPPYLRNKKNPVIGAAEPSVGDGVLASAAFIVFLFAAVGTIAALASLLFG